METQYQRSRIQEESLYYEGLKDSGELPIVGVNQFQNPNNMSLEHRQEIALIRASYDEKDDQIHRLRNFQKECNDQTEKKLRQLGQVVLDEGNVFAELMQTVRYASLGQITETLYRVGGQYRRSM
jgi:methylmalonyl-CoA mutase